jgi:drug/metabolite transporter (DMT)-like permease
LFSFGGVAWIMAAKGDVSLFSKGLWGDLMAIGAALCWVAYTLLNRQFSRSYQSLTVMAEEMVWGAVFLIPFSLALPLVRPSPIVVANLVFLAVVCSAVGYFIYLFCLRRLGAIEMTNYINLMPLVALGLSAWLLAEPLGPAQIIGSGLILLGVSLVTLGPNLIRRKEP